MKTLLLLLNNKGDNYGYSYSTKLGRNYGIWPRSDLPIRWNEIWWLILAIVIWLGWHVVTGIRETEEHEEVVNKAPGPDAHKSKITNW